MKKEVKLNYAISEAHYCLEEIDAFDLDSSDKKSMKHFNKLVKNHDKAVAKVIKIAKQL